MRKPRPALIAVAVAGSFVAIAAAILFMSAMEVITPTVAKLMLVELAGLYLGFGVLIAIYQLLRKLD
jgi:hypothetical protein